jgi:hypothetical protein
MSNSDIGEIILDERVVLEKFNGEVEDGDVVERLHFHNGDLEKHEWLENGHVVKTQTYTKEGHPDALN